MIRFRFVHAADLHLDTPFTGIGRVTPGIQDALRDASLDAFDALVELAMSREAAFVLLAGDIYDGPERGVRAQIRFRRGLERLSAADIRVVVVHGNHDPIGGWCAVRGEWPSGVTLVGSTSVHAVAVERGGQRLATVHGLSYARRDVCENLALRFRRGPEPGLQIGLLHCNVGGDPNHAAYSPCTVDDLRRAGMDYWALGHVHQRQVIRHGDPWIVYPGNIQGRSEKPTERGPKGAVVVDVEGGAVRAVEFAAVDRVRFLNLEVDVSGVSDIPALAGLLTRRAEELRADHEGRGLLVRVSLTGRLGGMGEPEGSPDCAGSSGLCEQLRRFGACDALLDELRHEMENVQPFFWWEGLQDRTRVRLEAEAIRRRGDFSAELLGFCDALAADPARLARLMEDGSGALRRVARPWPIPDTEMEDEASLLGEARELALDLLEADETA